MRDDDLRSLAQTIGGAALGVGIGLGILVLGFAVSRVTLADNVIDASTVSTTIAPSPTRAAASPAASATKAPATAAPAASATPRPTSTPDPLVVTGFRGQGLPLAALTVPAGYTFTSPVAGTVKIELYQFIDGGIRQGATDQPSYPYVYVTAADRQIKLRPGLVDTDVQLLVKDGDTVAVGAPLFKTLTTGASSWHTFYDAAILAQVVASVKLQPSGTDIDPVPTFKR